MSEGLGILWMSLAIFGGMVIMCAVGMVGAVVWWAIRDRRRISR